MAYQQYKIKLGVKVDTDSIKSQIAQATKNIKPIDIGVKINGGKAVNVNARVNSNDIKNQITRAVNSISPVGLNIKIDQADVDRQINLVKTKIKNLNKNNVKININSGVTSGGGSGGGKGNAFSATATEANKAYNHLMGLAKRMNSIRFKMTGLDAGSNQFKQLYTQLEALSNEYSELYTTFTKGLDFSSINPLKADINDLISIIRDLQVQEQEAAKQGLDTTKIKEDIAQYKGWLDELKVAWANFSKGLAIDGLSIDQIDNLSKVFTHTSQNMETLKAKMRDTSYIKGMTQDFKQLHSITKQIGSMSQKIEGLRIKGGHTKEVSALEAEVRELYSTYNRLKASMEQRLGRPFTSQEFAPIQAEIQKIINNFTRMKSAAEDAKAALAINIRNNFSDYQVQDTSIGIRAEKIKSQTADLEDAILKYDAAFEKLSKLKSSGTATNDQIIASEKEYKQALKDVENQLRINEMIQKDANDSKSLEIQKKRLGLDIDLWLKNNSGAAKKFGAELQRIKSQINGVDSVGLGHLRGEFENVQRAAKLAGNNVLSFGDKLKKQFSRYSAYFSVFQLFSYGTQAIRDMYQQVVKIDTAMTELKKVTNETSESYNNFLKNAASNAKEIGTTVDGFISSTADFARLGYGFEDSQGLARVANIYAVVGDEIEGVEDATQSLVSTLAAFKDEMNDMSSSDFAMSIVDKMNEVSNNFAISSGGIGEALQRSASSMAAANNTLDETIAMITAANEVAQNPEKVGNAMKTISMRIRGAKTELEEAGEATDGMAESTASLRAEIMALSGVDIMLNEDTFKSTYQIMDELSEKWEDLSDIAQASIIELMAGKHQGNVFSSLMANFDTARSALETSLNSSGSAMAEHEKWQKSLEARINSLKASWQGLSQTFMSSDFLKFVLDSVIKLIDALDSLIDNIGVLPTLLGTFTLGKSLFGKDGFLGGFFKVSKNELTGFANGITTTFGQTRKIIQKEVAATVSSINNSLVGVNVKNGFTNTLNKEDFAAIRNYSNAIKHGVSSTTAFNNCMSNASDIAKKYVANTNSASVSTKGFTTYQQALSVSTIAQNKSLGGVTALIKEYSNGCKITGMSQKDFANAVMLTNPALGNAMMATNSAREAMVAYIAATIAGKAATIALQAATMAFNMALTMGVSAAITFVISKLDDWIETSKELSDRIDDVTSKYKEQHGELMKLKGDYDTSNEDSMISKFAKLSKGVNSLGQNVSLTADEYAEYQSIANTIADQIPSLVSGYDSQGNAILNCADNVEVLAGAYRNLIREQNAAVLENGEDYFKDFDNDFDANAENALNRTKEIAELSKMSGDELREYLSDSGKAYQLSSYLEANGVKRDVLGSGKAGYESYSEHVIRAIQDEQTQIKSILDEASADIEAYAENLGIVTDAYFSQQFLGEYSHMSDKMQNIITQAVSGFDTEFYADFLVEKDPYEALTKYYNEMLSAFDALSDFDKTNFEAAFDLKTQFNGGDISYGEYVGKLQEANSLIERLDVGDEVKSQIRLSLGLSEKDGKWVVEEYQTLLNRLTSKEYEIQLDTDSAKSFLDGLSSEELNVTIGFVEDGNEDFNDAIQNYKDILNEAKEISEKSKIDLSETVFGNIDTNARQVLEWNSENLEKYKEQLMSFEADDASWDKVKRGYEGAVSTVMGMWDTFEIDGKEVDIAFSPMLQTDNGAEVLSSGTVDTYINDLISKATEDGKWDEAELIALDTEGIEVDGQKIKGILAEVGDSAEAVSQQMHFVGKDGALASAEDFLNSIIEKQAALNEALNFNADIEIDTTALEALNTALTESASAMGLTSESISSLKSKYRDLDSYDAAALFERTGNGIKVNREELAKLEKEQNNLKKSEVQKHIDSLTEAYNDNVVAIDECANATERARLISENEGYKSKIEELAQYQAQLEGVTGAYQRWINAQETPEDYEGYQAVAAGYEDVKDELSRGIMGNASKEYIDLLSGEDLQGGTIDDYYNAWKKLDDKVTSTGYAVKDFFTVNDDGDITDTGIDRFFESLQKEFSKGENAIAKYNDEAKKWEYDFSQENLQKIQDEWGIGIEAIEVLLEAAASAGYDVDWGGILDNIDLDTSDFETLVSYAEKMQTAYNKIDGLEDVDFNFTATGIEEAETEIEKARQAFSQFVNADGTVNLEADGAEEMQFILSTLIIQKQQLGTPAIMKVDTSQIDQAKTDVIEVINKAKELQIAYENYEIAISTGVDVEGAQKDLNEAITGLEGTSADIRADLKLPTDAELEQALGGLGDIKVGATLDGTAVGALETKIQTECTPEVIAKVTGLDETAIQNSEGGRKVVYTPEHQAVDDYVNGLTDINKNIIFTYKTDGIKPNPKNITRTITYKYKTEGDVPEAYGTAHASGTSGGRAFARGNWGIKGNGVALGGELGQELVVRDGRFFTIGDKGAEFFQYKKNDIVFNAAQTESLFKYGGIKGAKPRGKMLASGSAFADGSAMSGGKAFAWNAKATSSSFANALRAEEEAEKAAKAAEEAYKKKQAALKAEEEAEKAAKAAEAKWKATVEESKFSKTGGNTSGSGSGGGGGSSSAEEDKFEETIDWIETKIDRIERAIDQLDLKANSVYKSWSERNNALADEIGKVGEEIDIQQAGYERYLKEANSVGLDESWAKKVRDGTIDIETITDEDLANKIKEYQDWYNKAIDCRDAVAELKEKEAELYAQRFEHIQSEYDGVLQGYEHTEAMLNEYISQAEERGHIVSKKYYQALIDNEKSNIAELKKEQADLIAARDEAVNSGTIVKYSEEW